MSSRKKNTYADIVRYRSYATVVKSTKKKKEKKHRRKTHGLL